MVGLREDEMVEDKKTGRFYHGVLHIPIEFKAYNTTTQLLSVVKKLVHTTDFSKSYFIQ